MTAVLTIISKNYLAFARTLMASVRDRNPGMARFVVLADQVDGAFDPGGEDFTVILSDELPIPGSRWFHFKYTVLELCTAIKPYAIEYLADRHNIDKLFYIDPDIKLYGSIEPVEEALDSADIIITPHLLSPVEDDGKIPGDLEILQSGAYNLGFLGVRINANTKAFLKWWQRKLYDHCYIEFNKGLFTDQKWMELVPGMFPNVRIERGAQYNVAYWNIAQRAIRLQPDGYTVNGEPLAFFHFSGFDPLNPEPFSKHQNRFTAAGLGDAKQLVLDYGSEVIANGLNECRTWRYAYGYFENGVPIVDICRRFARERPSLMRSIPDPFSNAGFQAYIDYWNSPADGFAAVGITRLVHLIHQSRGDLRRLVPVIDGEHKAQLLEWIATAGKRELKLPEPMLEYLTLQLFRDRQAGSEQQRISVKRRNFDIQWNSTPEPIANLLRPHMAEVSNAVLAGGRVVDWLTEPVPYHGSELPRAAAFVLDSREDLRRTFPEAQNGDTGAFLAWLITYGRTEYSLAAELTQPLQDALQRAIRSGRGNARFALMKYSAQLAARALLDSASGRVLPPAAPSSLPLPPVTPATGVEASRHQRVLAGEGLNIVGYFRSEMGVGEASRCAANAALAAGLPVSLNNFEAGVLSRTAHNWPGVIDNRFLYGVNLFNVNADQTEVLAANLPPDVFQGKYNIGYWAWELEEFPEPYVPAFSHYDEIWVPSSFCQDAISRKSPVPVVRIPHAVEVKPPAGVSRDSLGLPAKPFLFLTLFDVLSIVRRKNPHGVIEAFRSLDPAVLRDSALVIKINNGNRNPAAIDELRQMCADLPVVIIDRVMARGEVDGLIAVSGCLVSLHRSEGFGLTIAEAMYLGKPVIATAYSGNMDFTRHDNSFLVSYALSPVGPDCGPYPAGAVWAEPDIHQAAALMSQVYRDSGLRAAIGHRAQEFVLRNLAPAVIGSLMKNRIREIVRRSQFAAPVAPAGPVK
jgi:glycosyltransferase involved in cell wall biosynthesis